MQNTMDFDELVEMGIYVLDGYDENGEAMYYFDSERALEVSPDIYWAHMNAIDIALSEAIEEGYLERDLDADFNETLSVTEKGYTV